MHQELDVGAVSQCLGNRNRSLTVFMRGQKSPTLFVARLWDASLQCTKGGTVSEGRLAGSAAVRISFLGWQEGSKVQRQSKQVAFQEGETLKSTMFVWGKGCCFNRNEQGHAGPTQNPI